MLTNNVERILIDEEKLMNWIREMGRQITEDYRGKDRKADCILKGAVIFASDLAREIVAIGDGFYGSFSYGSSTKSSSSTNSE